MPYERTLPRLRFHGLFGMPGFFLISNSYLSEHGVEPVNFGYKAHRENILDYCRERNIGFAVFDNKSTLYGGDENDAKTQDEYNRFLDELKQQGTSTLTVCHIAKAQRRHGNTPISARGSYNQEDRVDEVITLDYPENYKRDDRCRFVVRFEKPRNIKSTEETSLLKAGEMKLIDHGADGKPYFQWKELSVKQIKNDVLEGIADGKADETISEEMGISKKRVKEHKTSLGKDKLVSYDPSTKKWRLTEEGNALIYKIRTKTGKE
jgi:hypothetical protein